MKFILLCSKILIFYCIILSSCSFDNTRSLDETEFIDVYARLTIINELNTNKEHQNKLVEELLYEFNIQVNDIQNSVEIYQENPRQWLSFLEKVKDKINELRKKESAIPRS